MINAQRKPSKAYYTTYNTHFAEFSDKYNICASYFGRAPYAYYILIHNQISGRQRVRERIERETDLQTDFKSGGGGGRAGEDNWTCVWSPFYSVEDDYAKMSLFCVGHTVPTEAETHVCKLHGAMRGCASGSGFALIWIIEPLATFRLQAWILLYWRHDGIEKRFITILIFLHFFIFFLI